MSATNTKNVVKIEDSAKLEFYRLVDEGYKAMQNGRTSTIEEVREKLQNRRAARLR